MHRAGTSWPLEAEPLASAAVVRCAHASRGWKPAPVFSSPAKRHFPGRKSGLRWRWILGFFLSLIPTPAAAQILRTVGPFDVTFYNNTQSDGGATGAVDWTPQQMDDIAAALSSWTNGISNAPGRQVKLHLFWNSLGTGVLGQSSNQRSGDGTTSWTNTEHVWRDKVNVADGSTSDCLIQFGTGVAWNFGAGVPTSSYDFRSVSGHEIGHTLGFVSTYDPGSDKFSSLGLSAWDKNLIDNSNVLLGNRPVAGGTGTLGDFNQVANPVYFTGTNAKGQNGGNNVPVYAPNPYVPGSSMSHLNQASFPNALMHPQFSAGQSIRTPTALEWGIMQDLGWSVIGTKTWNKLAGTLNWTDAANWNSSGVPDQGWNVSFTNTGLAGGDTVLLSGSQGIHTLSINNTASFTIGGSGSLQINGGNIVRTPTSSGTQTIARPVTLGANATWDIGGAGRLVFADTLGGAVSVTKISSGEVALAGAANLSSVILNDGDLTLAAGGSLTVGTLSGASTANLGGALDFEGGSLTLTGSNSYDLHGVRVGRDTVASYTLPAGKTLTTEVFLTIGRNSGGQGTFVNESGTVVANTNLIVGAYDGSSGTYRQQTAAAPGSPLPSTTVANTTYLGGSQGITQGGTGAMELQSGTYTTQTLQLGYTGPGTITQTGGTMTVNGNFTIAGGGQGIYNLNGGTLATGTLAVGANPASLNFGGGTLKATAALSTAVPITLNAGGGSVNTNGFSTSLTGAIGGTGGLTKTGPGSLTLSGGNSYSGPTQVNTGTLNVNSVNTGGGDYTTAAGTFLDFAASMTVGHIDGTGTTTLQSNTSLTASYIVQNTLQLSAGSTLTILPTTGADGATLLSTASDAAGQVPEPSIWLLLLSGILAGLLARVSL
jgi:autotransporter-associated beta strand protein